MIAAPAAGTDAHYWWQRGTVDEANARDEGLSHDARELRDTLDALARLQTSYNAVELVAALSRIYSPVSRRERIRLAWQLIRDR